MSDRVAADFRAEAMTPAAVGVLGAGTMGVDVALDLAGHGYRVILKDVSEAALRTAKDRIRQRYRFVKMVKTDVFRMPVGELLDLIDIVSDYRGFERSEVVLENITENFEEKRKLYLELRDVCREGTLFGVNTSCISITRIGDLMPCPGDVVGMHFLNPVPLKPLVEVVRGRFTSDGALDRTCRFLATLGKRWVVVNDMPGFASNRVLMVTINECAWLVRDKVASASDVDTIFTAGFLHKMGPLATADLVGLDTVLDSLAVLHESYNDSKYVPCPLLKEMVGAGLLGRKSGEGFFKYGV